MSENFANLFEIIKNDLYLWSNEDLELKLIKK